MANMNNHPKKQFCPKGHDKDIVGRTKDGHCKVCRKSYLHDYLKEYYIENLNEIKKQHKEYKDSHKEACLQSTRDWHRINKDIVRAYKTEYEFNRRKVDLDFKLKKNLRHRLYLAIRRNTKKGSAVKDLGCSIPEFKKYIESKFYANMTWDNYGKYWQLDHVIPLHKFDLTNRDQFVKAFHYTNYQPLTIEDHRNKSNEELKVKSHDK